MSGLIHTQWTHPNLGEIEETLCEPHDREVHNALRTLGIGSISWDESDATRTCRRCRTSLPARMWLRERAR